MFHIFVKLFVLRFELNRFNNILIFVNINTKENRILKLRVFQKAARKKNYAFYEIIYITKYRQLFVLLIRN